MQLNSINYFVTIAQEKSISKAADKLFGLKPVYEENRIRAQYPSVRAREPEL